MEIVHKRLGHVKARTSGCAQSTTLPTRCFYFCPVDWIQYARYDPARRRQMSREGIEQRADVVNRIQHREIGSHSVGRRPLREGLQERRIVQRIRRNPSGLYVRVAALPQLRQHPRRVVIGEHARRDIAGHQLSKRAPGQDVVRIAQQMRVVLRGDMIVELRVPGEIGLQIAPRQRLPGLVHHIVARFRAPVARRPGALRPLRT